MRAGLYARISEDRDETQLGVGRQVEDCEALARARGWEIVDRYVDNDIGAYKRTIRPEYRRMLADLAAKRINTVVIYHQDRLHRQPRELEEFFDVCDAAGVTNLATVSGDIDLGTHEGRFTARIMGAVARKSSDDQSRRLKRKALQLAQQGKPRGGGSRPFGFEEDRQTIRLPEAAIIREVADRLLAGESLRGVCVDLNTRGVLTTTGGTWKQTPLRRMISSPRLSGQRVHNGEIVGDAVWPAIISREHTARLAALFADPSRLTTRAPRSYLLKGLVRCWNCGAVLVGRPRIDGQRRYVCASGPNFHGCGAVAILSEPLEQFVVGAVLRALDSPDLADTIKGRRVGVQPEEWQGKVDALAEQMDELARMYAARQFTMREWLAARDLLQAELDFARRRVVRSRSATVVEQHLGKGGELEGRWDEMSIDQQAAIVGAVIAHVTVGPGRRGYNRFDPARLTVEYRH